MAPPPSFQARPKNLFFKKIFGDSEFCRIFAVPFNGNVSLTFCGNSSVGRARPCQGRGREFESRFPLQTPRRNAGRFCLWGRCRWGCENGAVSLGVSGMVCYCFGQGLFVSYRPCPFNIAFTLLRARSGGQGLRLEIKPCPKESTTLPRSIADPAPKHPRWTLPAEWTGRQSGSKERIHRALRRLSRTDTPRRDRTCADSGCG